jgi:hypothetical protein
VVEQDQKARSEASALERRMERGQGSGPVAPPAPPTQGGHLPASDPDRVGAESAAGPGDLRTRDTRYFHFKYFNNKRDFGQRAEFEGALADALEQARRHSASALGASRESPVDVVLYTREEFALHHGAQAARAIAGLYGDNAIRVNAALELNAEHRATLVHEYIHAVVDELAQGHAERIPTWMNEGLAEYLEWRYQGRDDASPALRTRLRALAKQNALPHFDQLAKGALVGQSDPATMYAYSALAARTLMQQAGAAAYVRALRAIGEGQPLEEVFPSAFGLTNEQLERSLLGDLSGR